MELPQKIIPNRQLLQSDDLLKYIMEMTVYPREEQVLKQLRDATSKNPIRSAMASDPHASQLMGLLLKILNPQRTIEIGVYTGYSLLVTAISTPPHAKITAIDTERAWYEIGLPYIQKAGVEHKINFIESEAIAVLDNLLVKDKEEGSYDFAFVDADKDNYINYHERLMKLVRVGGLIIYDNTLWGGTVAMPEEQVPIQKKQGKVFVDEFNRRIASDHRLEICLAPLGDGVTICRRIS
ncbi:Probable caffeoyl-CoA O-methyltransferase At4g26220 [Linum perenne]